MLQSKIGFLGASLLLAAVGCAGSGGESGVGQVEAASTTPGCEYLVVHTQSEVDALKNKCTEIGDLLIDDSTGSVTSLAALRGVTRFNGNTGSGGGLRITSAKNLASLADLSGVTYIHSAQFSNTKLASLAGLSGLLEVHDLTVSSNASLTSLSGMTSMKSINGATVIWDNPVLPNLKGLEFETATEGMISIQRNATLSSLEGLQNLTTMNVSGTGGGALYLKSNPKLSTLDHLSALTSIGGAGLFIWDNDALVSTTGMSKLAAVTGHVWIEGNDSLAEIAGIYGIKTIPGSLVIKNNPVLGSVTKGWISNSGGKFFWTNGPLVETIGVDLDVSDNGALTTVTFDSLKKVGGPGLVYGTSVLVGGNVTFSNNASLELAGTTAQALAEVTSNFTISNNAVTKEAGFPTLQIVVGSVDIRDNPKLDNIKWPKIADIGHQKIYGSILGWPNLPKTGGTLSILRNKRLNSFDFSSLSRCSVGVQCVNTDKPGEGVAVSQELFIEDNHPSVWAGPRHLQTDSLSLADRTWESRANIVNN